ncbi:MAG: hypothetical protein HY711_06215, partial [Candidatus Melainabacteria bacterium]|nr:hypothetical protein [Candidatus Melainabacteria bacterium]
MKSQNEITTVKESRHALRHAEKGQSGGISANEMLEEVLIRYNPYAGVEKWFKYRFSAWSEAKAWAVVTLGVLFFSFGGPGLILQAIVFILMGRVSPQAAAAAATANQTMLWFLLWAVAGIGFL